VVLRNTRVGEIEGVVGDVAINFNLPRQPSEPTAKKCDGLLQPCNKRFVPAREPEIPFGTNFEVALVFSPPALEAISLRFYFYARYQQSEYLRFLPEVLP
jgi:hypothetical protein